MAPFWNFTWHKCLWWLGGTVKRLAARNILQRPYKDQITSPYQLYQLAADNTPGVTLSYCSNEEYQREKEFLESGIATTKTISGTRKFPSFVPIWKSKFIQQLRNGKNVLHSIQVIFCWKMSLDLLLACLMGGWLACVLDTDVENAEIWSSLLHPPGRSQSYKCMYPTTPSSRY